jgi:osmotically-inducible protein OsmY
MRRVFVGLSGIAVAALLIVACAQSDPGITTAVKAKMAADDTVKSYRIDVDTKDHVVTLSGAVDTPQARERAVEIARKTDGVRDVVDRLTVTPGATPTTGIDDPLQQGAREKAREAKEKASEGADKAKDAMPDMGDAAITTKVKTKFLGDTEVPGMKIDVDTKDGVVTLSGAVSTTAEKQRAVQLAKATDGVKSVVDRMTIEKKTGKKIEKN